MENSNQSVDGKDQKKGKRAPTPRYVKILAVVLLFCVYAVVANMQNNDSSAPRPAAQAAVDDRKIKSIVFAKEIIKGLLKSPSTANFTDVQAYELSNQKDVWAVNGYVDSENSFGAMLRSTWEVQLDYRNGKGGTVKSVLFDGKKIQ